MKTRISPSPRRDRLAVLLSTSILSSVWGSAAFADADSAGTAVEEVQITDKAIGAPSAIGSPEQARLVQKYAPNIVEAASQEEIKDIPDFVLGDAVRRLPGASVINKSGEARSIQIRGLDPNLNGVSFEGVLLPAGSINSAGRAVPLDAIPAPLVGGVELSKTNTPEQEASALGGQLNLLSRDLAPDEDYFFEAIGAGGFRSPHSTSLLQGTVSAGLRFGLDNDPFVHDSAARKPFTVSVFATDLTDWLHMDDLQQSFADKSNLPSNTLTRAQQIEYVQSKVRRGYGGAVTWDVDADDRLYFKTFYSGIDFHPEKYQLIYNFSNPAFGQAVPNAYSATTALSEGVNDNLVHDDEQVSKFGGVSDLGAVKVDYWGAHAANRLYSPYSYTGTLNGPTISTYVNNVTAPLLPTVAPLNGANVTNYAAYTLSSLSNFSQDDRDDEWSGHVGLTAPLDVGPVHGSLSAGGGLRLEHVTHDDLTYSYTGAPALTGAQLAGSNAYTIFDGAYNLGTPVSAAAIRNLINSGLLTRNIASDARTNQQALLSDNETVYNGYIEYSGNWRNLGVLAGVRYEKTDGIYRGTATSVTPAGTILSPNSVRQDYDNFFPTIQLRYALTDDLIARANWSTAIGRPGFSQLTATQTINYSAATVSQGNPNLKPTTGSNYDASVEYYLSKGGIVSIGGFDKEFSNYVVATTLNETFPGIQGTAAVSSYSNIPHASARGFELNYRQQMVFLPGLWSGLGLGANFTYVDSHGASRSGVAETLLNTAPRIFNVQAFYDYGPVTLTFDGNYQGLTMTSLGSTPSIDNYVQPYLTFDFGARYALTHNLTVFAEGRNVTNTKQNATEGKSSSRFTELQYFGSSYLFGIDFKI